MKQSIVSFLFLFILGSTLQAQIKSPSEFLPNYGKQITFYHQTEWNNLVIFLQKE